MGRTMPANIFFDTNVIAYFASENDVKAGQSARLLEQGGVISVQVLNEFARASIGKRKLSYVELRTTLHAVKAVCKVVPLTVETHDLGLVFAERYQLGVYDSMIVSAAVLAECATLYSEDMHDGLVIDGLTIRNPYKTR